ncbi:class I SAM-dependent methyltransferase [Microbulbifer sp. OS29]|uniref:Class I SAM-dependent methyltransferase n=1 Tax=Microbulbifer okhotskensis TaxID=2926617 RepID=A0A9X2EUR1_9GAMM|nr:class I SAM-dependent methyltransferase [Microbulbifer okhotskensis]
MLGLFCSFLHRFIWDSPEVRADLNYAVSLLGGDGIAVDCGCGAGSDIAFLRKNDFTVYGFDIEEESILRCRKRFKNDKKVLLSLNSFSSFVFPYASLILADASLFFCPQSEFKVVWSRIGESLASNGVFCGSFLGPNDTMAGPKYDRQAFWPNVMVFTEDQLRKIFTNFDVVKWTEHKISGESAKGVPHHWHIFSVVAKKL